MKKIFTCIFCAVLAISSWGTEVTIGSGTETNHKYPLFTQNKYSLTQFIYLSSEIGDVTDATISKISFYAASGNYTRNISLYIEHTSNSDLLAWVAVSSSPVFSGNVTIPDGGGWYDIPLSSNFTWNKSSNLLFTITDNTNSTEVAKNHYVFEANSRGRATGGTSAKDPTNPSGGLSVDSYVPQIKLTFGSDTPTPTPTPTPTLTATCSQTNFGIFAKDYEVKQSTITVTGENLTEDVSITADAGMTVSPTNLSKEEVMTNGGAIVTVTTTNAFVTNKKVTISANSLNKSITFTGEEAVFTDRITVAFMNNLTSIGGYANLTAASTKIESVDASNHSFVIGTSSTATIDYESVPGAYATNGTISGLKVKKTGEDTYKAFAFNYTAPVVTGITIDENADNSAILAANNGKSVTVNFTRSLTQGMYNTICLPISLNEANVSTTFGYGCSLISLSSSTYNDGVITLNFAEESSLDAGKPYLVKPTKAFENPSFNNWLVSAELHSIATTYVDFIPVINPTELPQSKEILFMGTNNELFWPTEAGTLKGMRCYFKVNFQGTPEGSAIAGAPVRMSIIKSNGITTDLPMMWSEPNSPIIMYKNQLFIIKDNKLINISGQTIQ